MSEEEKRVVDLAAAQAGLTSAGYAAKAAVAAASGDAGPAGAVAGGLRELQRELFAARRAVVMFGSNVNQAAVAFNATGELPAWVGEAVRLCAGAVGRLDEVTVRIHRRLR